MVYCFHWRMGISIHTPARGVTSSFARAFILDIISIHTPARGVTIFHNALKVKSDIISIHTPARGVTLTVYIQI